MSKKVTKQDTSADHLIVFQEKAIRRLWNNEEWWFSVVDVCGVLSDSPDAGAYWRKLKQRLNAGGSQPVTFCHGLKLLAPDGKLRETDCTNTEGLFSKRQLDVKINTKSQSPSPCQLTHP